MATRLLYDNCLACGEPLPEQATTGRRRRFCNAACRMRYHRGLKRWAKRAVDAALAGEPEPPKDYRAETHIHWTEV